VPKCFKKLPVVGCQLPVKPVKRDRDDSHRPHNVHSLATDRCPLTTSHCPPPTVSASYKKCPPA
jgi:hypothetical protein